MYKRSFRAKCYKTVLAIRDKWATHTKVSYYFDWWYAASQHPIISHTWYVCCESLCETMLFAHFSHRTTMEINIFISLQIIMCAASLTVRALNKLTIKHTNNRHYTRINHFIDNSYYPCPYSCELHTPLTNRLPWQWIQRCIVYLTVNFSVASVCEQLYLQKDFLKRTKVLSKWLINMLHLFFQACLNTVISC